MAAIPLCHILNTLHLLHRTKHGFILIEPDVCVYGRKQWAPYSLFKLLAPELFFLILAHTVYKM